MLLREDYNREDFGLVNFIPTPSVSYLHKYNGSER
jgi:hypothetical protein